MIAEVQSLLDKYSRWLKDQTQLRQIGDYVEITTPYLDRHNDCLQIYAKPDGGGFLLTDDGYTIEDLELSGCSISSPRRQDLLRTTLRGFGVSFSREARAIEVRASADNFASKKHNLVQAMLAINDLFYLTSPDDVAVFREDVEFWFDECEIRYTPRVKFGGRTGYDHFFDFVIPRSNERPERILRAINRPDRSAAQTMVFAWMDTREERSREAQAYAILNDLRESGLRGVVEAMQGYGVRPVLWSERDAAREELAA